MRLERRRSALVSRLFAASLLVCALGGPSVAFGLDGSAPASPEVIAASAESVTPTFAPAGVRMMLPPTPAVGPAGWETLPVVVSMVPEGPGTVWYRIGAAPGPWLRYRGPVVVPEGKQLLGALLVAPDGSAGPISEVIVRSDFEVRPIAGAGSSAIASSASYSGTPSVAGSVQVRVTVMPAVGTEVRRIGGQNRYDVSTLIAGDIFQSPDYVIIASGEKFPDALSASGLAGCLGAPLLLVRQNSVPPQIADSIRKLGAQKAIVCGGPATVSEGVLASLRKQGLAVERIGGPTRYDVGANIAARINQITGGSRSVYVARGDVYPDALSLGPLAYTNKAPILLVRPGLMPPATRAALQRGGYTDCGVAGGTASVTPGIEAEIRGYTGSVTRWGGQTRYDTSVSVASAGAARGNSWGYVGIAKGTVFSDALCGGVAAGKSKGVILLTAPEPLTQVTSNALIAHAGDVRQCDVFGGPVSVSNATFTQIRAIFR